MDEDEDVKDNLCDPKRVWKVGPGLGLVKELEHPVDPGHPVQPEDDRAGHLLRALALEEEVGKIGGQDAEHVQLEPPALSVVLPQHGGLLDHDALVQVALVHPHQKVEKVDCVADVVDNQPTLWWTLGLGQVVGRRWYSYPWKETVQLPKDTSPDDEEEVVHHGKVDDNEPVVMVIFPES